MRASISSPNFCLTLFVAAQSSMMSSNAWLLLSPVFLVACWSICTLAQRGILNERVRYGPFLSLFRYDLVMMLAK